MGKRDHIQCIQQPLRYISHNLRSSPKPPTDHPCLICFGVAWVGHGAHSQLATVSSGTSFTFVSGVKFAVVLHHLCFAIINGSQDWAIRLSL